MQQQRKNPDIQTADTADTARQMPEQASREIRIKVANDRKDAYSRKLLTKEEFCCDIATD